MARDRHHSTSRGRHISKRYSEERRDSPHWENERTVRQGRYREESRATSYHTKLRGRSDSRGRNYSGYQRDESETREGQRSRYRSRSGPEGSPRGRRDRVLEYHRYKGREGDRSCRYRDNDRDSHRYHYRGRYRYSRSVPHGKYRDGYRYESRGREGGIRRKHDDHERRYGRGMRSTSNSSSRCDYEPRDSGRSDPRMERSMCRENYSTDDKSHCSKSTSDSRRSMLVKPSSDVEHTSDLQDVTTPSFVNESPGNREIEWKGFPHPHIYPGLDRFYEAKYEEPYQSNVKLLVLPKKGPYLKRYISEKPFQPHLDDSRSAWLRQMQELLDSNLKYIDARLEVCCD